jgi:hypothetical protein
LRGIAGQEIEATPEEGIAIRDHIELSPDDRIVIKFDKVPSNTHAFVEKGPRPRAE